MRDANATTSRAVAISYCVQSIDVPIGTEIQASTAAPANGAKLRAEAIRSGSATFTNV